MFMFVTEIIRPTVLAAVVLMAASPSLQAQDGPRRIILSSDAESSLPGSSNGNRFGVTIRRGSGFASAAAEVETPAEQPIAEYYNQAEQPLAQYPSRYGW